MTSKALQNAGLLHIFPEFYRYYLKMKWGDDMKKGTILVCLYTALCGGAEDKNAYEKLEELMFSAGKEASFALLGEPLPAERRYGREDESIIREAERNIMALSEKHGASVSFFYRARRRNEKTGRYASRGGLPLALYEICRFLRGDDSPFAHEACNIDEKIEEILFLGADAVLPLGMMENMRTRLHETGAGLLVPYVREGEKLCDIFGREHLCEDACLVGVDALLQTFSEGEIPSLLSLEAVMEPACFIEKEAAQSALEAFTRYEKGCASPFFSWNCRQGNGTKRPSKGGETGVKWGSNAPILPIFLIFTLLLGSFWGDFVLFWALFGVISFLLFLRKHPFFYLSALPQMAFLAVSGMLSKRELLLPFRRVRGHFDETILYFSPAMTAGLLVFCIGGNLTKLLGILWMISPFVFFFYLKNTERKPRLCALDREKLMRYARDTWRFFSHTVTEKANGLPSSFVSVRQGFSPSDAVRPRDIGFYLLALLTAHDLGLIDENEMKLRAKATLFTLWGMEKRCGNLFSQYERSTANARSGEISAEENRILAASLSVFSAGLSERADMGALYGMAERLKREMSLSDLPLEEPKKQGHNKDFPDLSKAFFLSRIFFAAGRRKGLKGCFRAQKRRALAFGFEGKRMKVFGRFPCRLQSISEKMLPSSGVDAVSPYASFLMLEASPEAMLSNLSRLEKLGTYGKFGFYEAISGDRVVTEGYDSAHLGMSLAAIANLLLDGVMRRRFFRDPAMRAARGVCQRLSPFCAEKSDAKAPKREESACIPVKRGEFLLPPFRPSISRPDLAMVSNNKTRALVSSSGHIMIKNGRRTLCFSAFSDRLEKGELVLFCRVDGEAFPTVPLMEKHRESSSHFTFLQRGGAIEIAGVHELAHRKVQTLISVSVLPDRELVCLSLSVSGGGTHIAAGLQGSSFLQGKAGVFHRYFEEEGAHLWEDEAGSLFGLRADSGGEMMCENGKFSHICPAVQGRRARFSFYLGTAEDREDLLYFLAEAGKNRARQRKKQGELLGLQYGAAGLSRSVLPLERAVLRGLYLGGARKNSGSEALFERFMIASEGPIAVASSFCAGAESALCEVLSLFKFMCIRGVRMGLVILYQESARGDHPARDLVFSLLKCMGCEELISPHCGIFPLDVGGITPEDRTALLSAAGAVFDLSKGDLGLS